MMETTFEVSSEPTNGMYLRSNLATLENDSGEKWILDQIIPSGFLMTTPTGQSHVLSLQDLAESWIAAIKVNAT